MPALAGAFGLLMTSAGGAPAQAEREPSDSGIRHVLLISIDGIHAADFTNCTGSRPSTTAVVPTAQAELSSQLRGH
jgi:hypothetical protein